VPSLPFTFRTTANARNRKAKELKINGNNSPQGKRKHLSQGGKKQFQCKAGQAAWGAWNMLFLWLCGTGNCPSLHSILIGLSSLPWGAKHILNLEGLLLYLRKAAGKAGGTLAWVRLPPLS